MSWNRQEKINCEVEYVDDMEDEEGNCRDGVIVTCSKCGHPEESFGQGEASIRRCLALLHENCPEGEDNWYEEEYRR